MTTDFIYKLDKEIRLLLARQQRNWEIFYGRYRQTRDKPGSLRGMNAEEMPWWKKSKPKTNKKPQQRLTDWGIQQLST